jgi:hypothetical protein
VVLLAVASMVAGIHGTFARPFETAGVSQLDNPFERRLNALLQRGDVISARAVASICTGCLRVEENRVRGPRAKTERVADIGRRPAVRIRVARKHRGRLATRLASRKQEFSRSPRRRWQLRTARRAPLPPPRPLIEAVFLPSWVLER